MFLPAAAGPKTLVCLISAIKLSSLILKILATISAMSIDW